MDLLRTALLCSIPVALAACGEAAPRLVNAAGGGSESTGGAPAVSATGGAPSAPSTGGVLDSTGGTATGGRRDVAGGAGVAGISGASGAGSAGTAGSGGTSAPTPTAPSVPNVLLVVDRSLSMLAAFGTETRWGALQTALLDPALGVIPEFEARARFGLALFTGPQLNGAAQGAECPILVEVPTAAASRDQLVAAYQASEPLGTTPTGESLELLWPKLATLDQTAFPGPNAIVLATDGEPNTCGNTQDMAEGRARSESAIADAHAAGIRTFVLSVGDDISTDHLRRIANLGQGLPAEDPSERFLRVDEPAALRAALGWIFDDLLAPVPSP